MSDPLTMWAFYTDSPSSLRFNEIQKREEEKKEKTKEYCSEAVLKVKYIIYTENRNATLNFVLFPGEEEEKEEERKK